MGRRSSTRSMKRSGHLGIFVSAGVARKEHGEFSSNIDLIDVLPPGLYEAVFEAKTDETEGADFVTGDWVMRCEARTLDDIRALGGNDAADDRRFATAARVSEINLALYRTFVQPFVRAAVLRCCRRMMQRLHPLRLQYELLSDTNPVMGWSRLAAEQVRAGPQAGRRPTIRSCASRRHVSKQIVGGLDSLAGHDRGASPKRTFQWVYGSPALQAAVGIDPADERPQRKAGRAD